MFEQARAKLGEFGDFLSRYKHFPVKLVFVKSAREFSQTHLGFYEPMQIRCMYFTSQIENYRILQLVGFPKKRVLKLLEKKKKNICVPCLSVASTGVPLLPRPHQQPYPL